MLIFVGYTLGCNTTKENSSSDLLKNNIEQISGQTDKIIESAKKIINTTGVSGASDTGGFSASLLSSTIRSDASSILSLSSSNKDLLQLSLKDIKLIENKDIKIDELTDKLNIEKSSTKKNIDKIWILATWMSLIGIVAGIVLIALNMRYLGGCSVVGSIGVGVISYFMSIYAIWVAGFIAIVGLLLVIYLAIKYIKKQNAVKELVKSTEIIKNDGWNDKTKIEILKIQSDSTIDEVAAIREEGNE